MIIGLSNCIESITHPEGRFRTLTEIYPVMDEGIPVMRTEGNGASFSMVFRGENYLLRTLPQRDDRLVRRLKEISTFVQLIDCPFLSDFSCLEQEMLVFSSLDRPVWIDVLLQKVPGGQRMDRSAAGGTLPAGQLIGGLSRLAGWMTGNEFRHGKIDPKNIWISPGLDPILSEYTGCAREVPDNDVKAIGMLAALLYLTACEPGFCACPAYDDFFPLPELLATVREAVDADGPQALKELIAQVMEGTATASAICKSIKALADCQAVPIEALSRMATCSTAAKSGRNPCKNGSRNTLL